MSIRYQIDPCIPSFVNGAVFYTQTRTPAMKQGTTSDRLQPPSDVLFCATNVSPQWNQAAELVLQRLMLCQGSTPQRCAAWICEPGTIVFAPALVEQRDQERAQKGLHPPLLHIPETEALSMLTRFIEQAIMLMQQEIMMRERDAAAGLFSLQTLAGKRRLLSLLQTTREMLV